MNRSDLRVAVREIDSDEIVIHVAGDPSGNYDTLCGVSTSDDLFEEVDASPRGRVDCPMCWKAYQMARAMRASDFVEGVRRRA